MYVEVPVLQRCCFCLPLRGGLMAWAYFRLIATSLFLCYLFWSILEMISDYIYYDRMYFEDFVPVILILLLIIADVCLHVVFVVGGHKRDVKLLNVYYYYSWSIFVLTIIGIFYILFGYIVEHFYMYLDTQLLASLLSLLIQGYLLILVRSEIAKLNKMDTFGTLNKLAEAEKCNFKVDSLFKQKEVANYAIVQEK